MATTFGTLGDFFPDTDIRCRIKGCDNVWRFSGEDALQNVAAGQSPRPERMCDACFTRFVRKQDVEAPCSTPNCPGTWTWNRFQQVEAEVQGRSTPPNGLCAACQARLRQIQDKPMPCRMRGCSKTWIWPRKAQMQNGDHPAPSRLCDDCYQTLQQLRDRDMPCRIRGCEKTWIWNRYQQLEHILEGKTLDAPPRFMCPDCFNLIRELHDTEMPCRIKECSRTWVFSRYDQLEHRLRHGADAAPPTRMCAPCHAFFAGTQDIAIQCRNRGCRDTWLYSRSMQLHDWLRGRERTPARMCPGCTAKLESLETRDMPCSVRGCTGTWPWAPMEQLLDDCLGRHEPPARRCKVCEDFLAAHQAQTIPCPSCDKPMGWSAYEQLLCRIGTFAPPSKCPACAEQELALGRPPREVARSHHHVVKIPAAGRWHADERIRDWPPHLTYEVISRVEGADVRVVALGDDLTVSMPTAEAAWPALLERQLNDALAGRARVAVVNAGIAKTTSRQALVRQARDVAPFAPHLVIVSFLFADALLRIDRRRQEDDGAAKANEDELAADMAALCRRLAKDGAQVVHWIPNPSFPHDATGANDGHAVSSAWAEEQRLARDRCLMLLRHLCSTHNLPLVDLQSRFEVNGSKSARKWMTDWYNHNAAGAQNIATWLAEFLLNNNLLPLPTDSES